MKNAKGSVAFGAIHRFDVAAPEFTFEKCAPVLNKFGLRRIGFELGVRVAQLCFCLGKLFLELFIALRDLLYLLLPEGHPLRSEAETFLRR